MTILLAVSGYQQHCKSWAMLGHTFLLRSLRKGSFTHRGSQDIDAHLRIKIWVDVKLVGYSNRGGSLWLRRWVKLLRKTLRT